MLPKMSTHSELIKNEITIVKDKKDALFLTILHSY
jgi:hypothetical protein